MFGIFTMKSSRPRRLTITRMWSPRKVSSFTSASNSLANMPSFGASSTRSGRMESVVGAPDSPGATRSARTSEPPTFTSQRLPSIFSMVPGSRLFSPMNRATKLRIGSS